MASGKDLAPTQSARVILAATACALLACACVETYDGNGVPAEETRSVSGFERVSARGALDVELSQAATFGVSVRIDANLISRIHTSVTDRTLIVQVDGGNLGKSLAGPHVLVALPTLRDVELNGSGHLAAASFDGDESVSVELSGSGAVSWSGTSRALDAVLNGAGDLSLAGSATSLDLHLSGSGELDASALTARGASIELDGSGDISATVDGRVDARVDGSGSVELSGNVIRGTWEVSGGGAVTGP